MAESHIIENRAIGWLLYEAGDFTLLNGESLPVDDGIGTIGDIQRIRTWVRERSLPMRNLRPDRISVSQPNPHGCQQDNKWFVIKDRHHPPRNDVYSYLLVGSLSQ